MLLICLYVLAGLSVLFLTFIAIRVGKNFYKVKNVKPVVEEIVEKEEVKEEPLEIEDFKTETVENIEEETSVVNEDTVVPTTFSEINTQETPEVAVTEDEVAPKNENTEEVETPDEETIVIGDMEDEIAETDEMADKLNVKRVHFAQKLLKLDEHTMLYYDEIYNKFNAYRGVNARLSFKHVTFRYKRKLIAKLTIKGKTLKLHLALDTEAFNKNVYFQTSLESVKAYEEVPFTVKVKSGRGLKNALTLIGVLCEKEGVEPKSRFKRVNSIKEIMEVLGIK